MEVYSKPLAGSRIQRRLKGVAQAPCLHGQATLPCSPIAPKQLHTEWGCSPHFAGGWKRPAYVLVTKKSYGLILTFCFLLHHPLARRP